MALTNSRWLILVIASLTVLWFGLLGKIPEKSRPETRGDSSRLGPWSAPTDSHRALDRPLDGAIARTNDRLRLLEVRDSIVRLSRGDSLELLIDPRLSDATRQKFEHELRKQWATLAVTPRVPITFAFVIDTARTPHGFPRPRLLGLPVATFAPSPETGGRCVTVMLLGMSPHPDSPQTASWMAKMIAASETVDAALSPCALLSKFGQPGPRVAAWLETEGWGLAHFAGWNVAPEPWTSVITPEALQRYSSSWDALAGGGDASTNVRRVVDPPGIACLVGQDHACEKLVNHPPRLSFDSAWRASVIPSSGWSAWYFYFGSKPTPVGPASGWILSEMVRTLGPDRFAKFWTSSLSVSDAFKQADPRGLDVWMHDWMLRNYGVASVGPGVTTAGIVTGIAVLLFGVGLAIAIGNRRRVV
jgi:hypothetical protein